MNSELKKTVIIGSGNLAEALARAVAKSELELVQIFARNAERARVVAELAATGWETRPEMLRKDADIYLIAVSDRAVAEVAATLPIPEEAAVAHTAGSVPVTAIPERFARRAVFYPMQTFTRGREADFSVIPVFLEASSPELRPELEAFARKLSGTVIWADSAQRCKVHLAAVFACNFANHMYAVGERIVRGAGLDFDVLKPLIARVRPCDVNTAVQLLVARPDDFSFPSGHTGASFAEVTALYAGGNRLWIPALLLAALISFSRLYLYVHYPTDVLAGILLGAAAGWLGSQGIACVGRKLHHGL